jgi:chemotaxis protein MotB
LLIEGHTDATPYSTDTNYGNWELSADRANSARRLLQQDGVRANQVTQVRGYADQLLRVQNNPYDPSNRRVSILVKNGDVPGFKLAEGKGAKVQQEPKTAEGKATAQSEPPAPPAQPAPVAAPVPPKHSTAAPPAKLGLMDRLKGMMPGKKK